ncbi:HlyD family efflux transporter periplasmic adaptor subunit [Stenotrophomonas aracearum]|jgi:HlyD family secretion protein|uniref:HlyD family efflux transporter periplasmic adaptor subunit n=1 Tax=Stenotrophomonas aracearum TaxID=3003272 RepID=A0ABY9YI48_9GAMM|nr:HlyD family efflux transporter periplasmic adaptor subunit [Stenotrophomonas sp. A5588]WNH50018.1 HlyD family efflux transporter periplasmic adaptor subunit [Stenotrophomonas sp. A5588]
MPAARYLPLRGLLLAIAGCALSGCKPTPPAALGTLEWDRITVPASAAETIVGIGVREGQQVAAGAALLQLEPIRTAAQLQALEAQASQAGEALRELRDGPRREDIDQARATLASARAEAVDASAYYRRLQPLGRQQLVAASDVDRARAAAGSAQGAVRAAEQALLALEHGTRVEQVAQGEAALQAAQAQVAAQAVTLRKLDLVAPRAGRVDALPYKLGDQAPVGAPLVVLLVGERPYARVYLPEPLRLKVRVGQAAQVHLQGRDGALPGRVRSIRSDPTFTPYYALSGEDVSRLSWLAEIELDPADGRAPLADLPAGAPVRVEF